MLDFDALKNALGELDEDSLTAILRDVMADGGTEAPRAMEALQQGMDIIGERYEEGEYFVGDLIYAGELMTDAAEMLMPSIADSGEKLGRLILCTVKDDLHDIGKNICKAILEAGGFEIIDLGIDVAPETIVETARRENVRIIALSGILTLALDSMKQTVEAFRAAGMRENVKIIIGGAAVSANACADIGADEWAQSPQKTLNICKGWVTA